MRLTFTLLFSFIYSIAFSQVKCDWAKVTWGAPIIKPVGRMDSLLFLQDEITAQYRYRNILTFYELKADYNNLNTITLDVGHSTVAGRCYLDEIIEFGDKAWVMTRIKNDEKLTFHVYVQELNYLEKKLIGEPEEILSFPFLRNGDLEKPGYTVSDDKKRVVVSYCSSNSDYTEYWQGGKMFNANWDLEDESYFKMNIRDIIEEPIWYEVSRDGELQNRRTITTIESRIYRHTVYEVYGDSDAPELKRLYAKGSFAGSKFKPYIEELDLFMTYTTIESEGYVDHVGLYSDTTEGTQGIGFFRQINEGESVVGPIYNPFVDRKFYETKTDYYTESDAIKSDGEYFLFAEKRYQKSTKYYDDKNRYKETGYTTGFIDLMVVNLDENGSENWTVMIEKATERIGNYWVNPNLMYGVYDKSVYILYEERPIEFSFGDDTKTRPNPVFEGRIKVAKIDENGELKVDQLFVDEAKKMNKVWPIGHMPNTKNLVVRRKVKKGIQFAIIELN